MGYLFNSSRERCNLSNRFDYVSSCERSVFRHLSFKSIFIMRWTDEMDMPVSRAICLMAWECVGGLLDFAPSIKSNQIKFICWKRKKNSRRLHQRCHGDEQYG